MSENSSFGSIENRVVTPLPECIKKLEGYTDLQKHALDNALQESKHSPEEFLKNFSFSGGKFTYKLQKKVPGINNEELTFKKELNFGGMIDSGIGKEPDLNANLNIMSICLVTPGITKDLLRELSIYDSMCIILMGQITWGGL